MSVPELKLKPAVIDLNVFKKAKKVRKEKAINELITNLVLLQKKEDDGLKEISNMCNMKECDGERKT